LTGAVDERVEAIMPIVMDELNFIKVREYHSALVSLTGLTIDCEISKGLKVVYVYFIKKLASFFLTVQCANSAHKEK